MVYSGKLSEGSLKNRTSSLPIRPRAAETDVRKGAEATCWYCLLCDCPTPAFDKVAAS